MAASALIAISSESPILHTKKLGLSKGKGVAQGHPGSSAGQNSIPGLSEQTLEHTPTSSADHRGETRKKTVKKSCTEGGSRKLSNDDLFLVQNPYGLHILFNFHEWSVYAAAHW